MKNTISDMLELGSVVQSVKNGVNRCVNTYVTDRLVAFAYGLNSVKTLKASVARTVPLSRARTACRVTGQVSGALEQFHVNIEPAGQF